MGQVAQNKPIVDIALGLAEAGLCVFPCSKSKRPITKNGHKNASHDPDVITAAFSLSGAELIGVATGPLSGLFVVDFDTYKGPDAAIYLSQLEGEGLLPPTRVHKTRGGGLHYFYSSASGVYPNVVPTDGVDVKGDGGYVIWWSEEFGGEVVSSGVVDAPEALIAKLVEKRSAASSDSVEALKSKIMRGEAFHDSLARLAARYIGGGTDPADVTALLLQALRGSMASSPHHVRYDRWRDLMADKDNELSRIIGTAGRKYSSTGAAAGLADSLAAKMERTNKAADSMFTRYAATTDGDNGTTTKSYDPDKWPFEGQGYFAHENHDILKQKFVMHPIFCEGESILMAAEPKAGKTAISLTVGLHIACGLDLGTELRVAEPRSVIYLGLEGQRAIKLRIAAWRRRNDDNKVAMPEEIPMFVMENGLNLMDVAARAEVANKIVRANDWLEAKGKPSLGAIFIDTFTKAMPGGDQNSVEDTSAVFDVVSKMRDFGVTAAITFIHHLGKAGSVRGSSNIEADPDVLTGITKEGPVVTWTVRKARSVEEGGSYRFSLDNYDLGLSEQGYMINAPVVTSLGFVAPHTAANDVADAQAVSAVMKVIVSLGVGMHTLTKVLSALTESGNNPIDSKKGKQGPKSPAVQEYFATLIPDTGYVFGANSVTSIKESGIITGVAVR